MASLKDRVQNALDEGRTLILGAQVLLGAQYAAFFTNAWDTLSSTARLLLLIGLLLLLAVVGLLIAPASFHRIVERGEDSDRLLRMVHADTGRALVPMACAFALDLYVLGGKLDGKRASVVAALAIGAVAATMWWGIEWIVRWRLGPAAGRSRMGTEPSEPTRLKDKIRHVLTESRVVLPGAQALLGFQFTATLTREFDQLPSLSQWIHVGSLISIAITTILLMTPPAFHRIVEAGEDTERFHRFASRMVLLAMAPLSIGLSGDLFVVVRKVIGRSDAALVAALTALAALWALWYGYPMAARDKMRA